MNNSKKCGRCKKEKKRNQITHETTQKYIYEFLSNHPCIDCTENDPVVLDFDHQNNKKYSISDMIRQHHSIKSIKKEIQKCEVRCANCHRRKTAKEFGWYRIK